MSRSSFAPAGAEDSDEFDDDGFCFDGVAPIQKPSEHITIQETNSEEAPSTFRGGFGKPGLKSRPKTGSRVHYTLDTTTARTNGYAEQKRVREKTSMASGLPIDDFKIAIQLGNVDLIKKYLDDGVPVDQKLSADWTGLMYAADSAKPQVVQMLLDHGANANYSRDNYTVLMVACATKNEFHDKVLQTVELLIERGADCSSFDRHHVTPLMYAAQSGRALVMQKVLDQDVDVNKQDGNRGQTALCYAASKGHHRIVTILLNSGADANIQCTNGMTALDIAQEFTTPRREKDYKRICEQLEGATKGSGSGDKASLISTSTLDDPLASTIPAPQKQFEAKDHLKPSSSQGYRTVGELELFLHGLDCPDLVQTFTEHKIEFKDFLRMGEEDLVKLGVTKMGVRRKILDAIRESHKAEWKDSSLIKPGAVQTSYNKTITCQDAVAMVSNINNHISCMQSSIDYIECAVRYNPAMLQAAQEGKAGRQLHHFAADTMTNTKNLYEALAKLRRNVSQVLKTDDSQPLDRLTYAETHTADKYRIPLVLAGTIIVAGLLWRKDIVMEKFTSLYSSFRT